jgi:hypothetical protein
MSTVLSLDMVWMVAGVTVLGIEILFLLTMIGFGLAALAMPRRVGRPLLFAPIVGLGVALLANQWLTWFVPAPAALLLAVIGGGGLSLVKAWRLRLEWAPFTSRWRLWAGAAAIGGAWYLVGLGFLFRAGTFTLADYNSDAIKLYAPTAMWYTTHPYRPGARLPVTDPIVSYMSHFATPMMPGSVGTVPAGLSVLTGWPIHALFDPLQVLLLLLIAVATAALVHVGAGFSRGTALVAFAVVPASALLEWAVLSTYQQQLETMVLIYGGLALVLLARREESTPLWLLAAVTLAALPGAYMPMTLVIVVLLVPAALAVAVRRLAARRWPVDAGVVAGIVAGLVLAAPSLGSILRGGGLWLWAYSIGTNGGVTDFFPLPYDLGVAPVTRFTQGWPVTYWRPQWDPLAMAATIVLIALVVTGLGVLVRHGRLIETVAVACAGLYVAYLAVVVHQPYPVIKTMGYLTPVMVSLAAIAVMNVPSLRRDLPSAPRMVWPRAVPNAIKAAAGLALAGVVAMQLAANVEEQKLARDVGPNLEPSATTLTVLRTIVPHGAGVLLYDPHDWSKSSLWILWRYEAAAYALTGQANVDMVVEGPGLSGNLYIEWTPGQGVPATLRAAADRYDFVLTGPEIAGQVPKELHPVWMQADLGLELFKRGATAVASGGVARAPATTRPD